MGNSDHPETVWLDLIDDTERESVDSIASSVVLLHPPRFGVFLKRLAGQLHLAKEILSQEGAPFLIESGRTNQLVRGEPVIDDAFHAVCFEPG